MLPDHCFLENDRSPMNKQDTDWFYWEERGEGGNVASVKQKSCGNLPQSPHVQGFYVGNIITNNSSSRTKNRSEVDENNENSSVTLRAGIKARTAWQGLVESTVGLARAGNFVIVDDVCFEGTWQLEKWKQRLSPFHTIYIGIRCDPDVLQKRERDRRDRRIGSAKVQAQLVHPPSFCGSSGERGWYDLELNTSRLSPEECVDAVLNAMRNRKVLPRQ
mmetsp:Transcript_15701/g.22020  ORF Transcript_15701/g.22020 Transcript_15701/m.22020 type:complete len:218 (-) Transcript_15701:161-814(-)